VLLNFEVEDTRVEYQRVLDQGLDVTLDLRDEAFLAQYAAGAAAT